MKHGVCGIIICETPKRFLRIMYFFTCCFIILFQRCENAECELHLNSEKSEQFKLVRDIVNKHNNTVLAKNADGSPVTYTECLIMKEIKYEPCA
jgi:hypothetical protein